MNLIIVKYFRIPHSILNRRKNYLGQLLNAGLMMLDNLKHTANSVTLIPLLLRLKFILKVVKM
jgi:hypothetical protein